MRAMDDAAGASGRISPRLAGAGVLVGLLGAVFALAAAGNAGVGPWALLAGALALGLGVAGVALARARAGLRDCRGELTAEAAARREAERQARTDPVTGLLNRRGLSVAFDAHRRYLDERDLVISVLMFTADRFDQIRAAEGPEGVRSMLARLGGVLAAVLRGDDKAGRIDGDRFLLIVAAPRYARTPEGLARRLQEAVAATAEITCLGQRATLAVGITQTAAATMPFERIVSEAELALEAALADGSGSVVSFGPLVAGARARRSAALHTVAEAFAGGGPAILYQPIVTLGDRRVCAVEAVARFDSPGGGTSDTAALEQATRDPDLALRLSRHVQARATAELGRLRQRGVGGVCLAVGVAERQLADPGFAEALLDQLFLEGLAASDLWLAIGESVFRSRRLPSILDTLERLAAAGAECGLDRFGNGYASLAELRRCPLSWIKLHPALVSEIAADPAAREIAASARTVATAIGARVCAGGIDTAPVADAAAEIGFDCGQGAHFCPAVPFSELEGILRRGLAA